MKKEKNPIPRKDESFISDKKAAILNKTTFFENAILYIIILFILIGLVWAYYAKIDQIVVANGKVIPYSKNKVIQSLDGGIVKDILVEEGSRVEAGQILMQLDDTRYKSEYFSTYNKFLALSAMIARLTAETTGTEKIDFSDEVKKSAPELVKTETNLFEQRRESAKKENLILQDALDIATKEYEMYKGLIKEGTVSMLDYYRTQRNMDDIKEKILIKQSSFRETALTELNQRKGELSIIAEQLKSLNNKILLSTILSPVKGIIKKLSVTTIGGVITPGMTIMEIVPISDFLLIEARVQPSDIAFVHQGQMATVKFSAYDYTIYGSLTGTVVYVGADTIEEQKPNLSNADSNEKGLNVYYAVKVRTDLTYLGTQKHPYPILPGMTTTVYIMTGQKTILDYLLKPLLKAKEEALHER